MLCAQLYNGFKFGQFKIYIRDDYVMTSVDVDHR